MVITNPEILELQFQNFRIPKSQNIRMVFENKKAIPDQRNGFVNISMKRSMLISQPAYNLIQPVLNGRIFSQLPSVFSSHRSRLRSHR